MHAYTITMHCFVYGGTWESYQPITGCRELYSKVCLYACLHDHDDAFVLCMVEHGNCTAVRCICERMFTCVIAYACLHDHDAFVLCMAEHGNRISQSQAAAWWDAVVRVKAAKHGKATKV